MADFFTQTERLAKQIGDGTLSAIFAVDGGERTVPLEVGGWQNFMGMYGPKTIPASHYNKGEPHAIQHSLEQTHKTSLADVAKTTLAAGPEGAMKRHLESMDREFKTRAPIRTGEYRNSAARFLIDDGQPVHLSFDEHYGEDPGA